MKTTTRLVRSTLLGSSVMALLLGLFIWTGNGGRLIRVHELFGYGLILSVWGAAVIAARAGVSPRTVAFAVVWSLATLGVAVAQKALLPCSPYWAIQVLHAVTGAGAIAWGQHLLTKVREAAAGPSLPVREAAEEFLGKKRIAVTGVSRKKQPHGSNIVYQRLRQRGYEVFAINPNADQIEGDRCFHDLKSVPGGVDAVVIGTRPENAMATMRECADLGVKHVWMHRSVGTGSVSAAATAWGRASGIRVIDGGCPLMFEPTADPAHKVMRSVFTLAGKVPRKVP
ncbi:MAG TPA: CoA-binding protein [Polyangiaceae bacterium]